MSRGPYTSILAAFDWLSMKPLELARQALAEIPASDAATEGLQEAVEAGPYDAEVAKLVRRACTVAGKVRDTVLTAEAAEMIVYAEVDADAGPPKIPAERAAWILKRCIGIVEQALEGRFDEKVSRALAMDACNNMIAAIAAEPLEVRVEGARILREGKHLDRKEPGPEMKPAREAQQRVTVH